MSKFDPDRPPCALEIDLNLWGPGELPAVGAVRTREWPVGPDRGAAGPELDDALRSWSGSALGLALWREHRDRDPFILCVGEAVRRGLPTAARASLIARAPLNGRLVEGQVGSDFARRLARAADALVLLGDLPYRGAVLWLRADGTLQMLRPDGIRGLAPAALLDALPSELRDGAVLRVGLAGETAAPFANLAAGGEHPSFVGRGGLGANFGKRGLKALAVTLEPVPGNETSALSQALTSSPRLAGRAAEGGLEQYELAAARGELIAPSGALSLEQGSELSRQGRAAHKKRQGCSGCPTPCGWIFERPGGRDGGGRFNAMRPLGPALGLTEFGQAARLLDACDEYGLDAKEVGAVLASMQLSTATEARNDESIIESALRLIREMAEGEGEGAERMRAAEGSTAFERGLKAKATAAGAAARPSASLAVELGQAVSSRGSDPMRSFPFLMEGRAGRPHLEQHMGPLPAFAEDPSRADAKGRIVWWHENVAAALDATGFCAFSAAGLLADGVVDLDRLARWVMPRALLNEDSSSSPASPSSRLLSMGATLAALFHEENPGLSTSWGELPDRLREPGLVEEYKSWRGLAQGGALSERARASLASVDLLHLVASKDEARGSRSSTVAVGGDSNESVLQTGQKAGRVALRGHGPLREAIGDGIVIERLLPVSLLALLGGLDGSHSEARSLILGEGEILPSVYRSGERLTAESLIHDGDRLELLLVVAGG